MYMAIQFVKCTPCMCCTDNFWLTLHDDDAKRYVTFKEADQVILQSEVLALPQERQKGD